MSWRKVFKVRESSILPSFRQKPANRWREAPSRDRQITALTRAPSSRFFPPLFPRSFELCWPSRAPEGICTFHHRVSQRSLLLWNFCDAAETSTRFCLFVCLFAQKRLKLWTARLRVCLPPPLNAAQPHEPRPKHASEHRQKSQTYRGGKRFSRLTGARGRYR